MVGRILIVDGVAANRIVLKSRLMAACYTPELAADGLSCLRAALRRPDVILLDLALPDLPGDEVLRRLRAHPVTQDIPVLVLTGPDPGRARLAALEAGADDVLLKGPDDQLLLARLRSLLRASEEVAGLQAAPVALEAQGLAEAAPGFEAGAQIALLSDRPDRALRLRRELAARQAGRVGMTTRGEVLSARLGEDGAPVGPDVIVIDADLGGAGGGLRLLSDLRSRAATRHAAIVVLSAAGETEAAMAFDLGADDFWGAEAAGGEYGLRLMRLLQRKRRADRMRDSVQTGLRLAVIDPLTGLHNRRFAMPHLAGLARNACSAGEALAVMIVDIDRFKSVNDRWGHAAGDAVLVEVARLMAANLRPQDLLARIGGEEFLIALPSADLAEARRVAGRLCAAIEDQPITLACGAQLHITVSIGLAVGTGPEAEPKSLFDDADRALLSSKSAGRNQVTVALSAA